jgi:sulfur-carrier protein adenylyltransferase/sulfurtransferase
LTVYDALHSTFRSIRLHRDPKCRLCGEHPEIHSVANVETTAASSCNFTPTDMESITTLELRQKLAQGLDGLLIDVREPDEHAIASIEQARLIPLATLESQLASLPKHRTIYVHCKAGGRSARAVKLMAERGFANVVNVSGGMDQWLKEEGLVK